MLPTMLGASMPTVDARPILDDGAVGENAMTSITCYLVVSVRNHADTLTCQHDIVKGNSRNSFRIAWRCYLRARAKAHIVPIEHIIGAPDSAQSLATVPATSWPHTGQSLALGWPSTWGLEPAVSSRDTGRATHRKRWAGPPLGGQKRPMLGVERGSCLHPTGVGVSRGPGQKHFSQRIRGAPTMGVVFQGLAYHL